jgi:hypothetical protein
MPNAPTTSEAYEILIKSIGDLCTDLNSGHFRPLLESDVNCYLFHRMIENTCPLENLYSQTRIYGIKKGNRRYDLVIGHSQTNDATVVPSLVVQIKCFQERGQTIQQYNRLYKLIFSEDLPSLEQAYKNFSNCEVELIMDQAFAPSHIHGYLDGYSAGTLRREYITQRFIASSLKAYWVCNDDAAKMTFKILA